jgi:hypothetical protein
MTWTKPRSPLPRPAVRPRRLKARACLNMDYASSLLGLLPGGRRTPGLKELLNSVETYLPTDRSLVSRKPPSSALRLHKGQKRLSGEPTSLIP